MKYIYHQNLHPEHIFHVCLYQSHPPPMIIINHNNTKINDHSVSSHYLDECASTSLTYFKCNTAQNRDLHQLPISLYYITILFFIFFLLS